MKEEITSKKKKYSESKKIAWQQRTKDLLIFLFYWFWTGFCWVSDFLYFFFSLLIINHKHKCIQAKTFKTQASWPLHSLLISDIIQVRILVIMTKKKLKKICGTKMLQYHEQKNKGTLITNKDINK